MNDALINRRARLLFVAALMAVGLGAGAWYLLWSSGYTRYQIRTDDGVFGLTHDAPVVFHGVEVGMVDRIELLDPHAVRILIRVKKDAPVTTATAASIVSRGLSPKGLMGYAYVALEDRGPPSGRPRAEADGEYPEIPTAPSRDLSLDAKAAQINQLAQAVLDRKTIDSLKQAVAGMQTITATLSENNAKLASLISNAERASERLRPLLDSSGDSLKAMQTQILPQAYRALSELETLSDSLGGVADEIRRDPSVLIRGRARSGPLPEELR